MAEPTLQTTAERIAEALKRVQKSRGPEKYHVPSLWRAPQAGAPSGRVVSVNPSEFFMQALEQVAGQKKRELLHGESGSWTRRAIIYNIFVRTTCAFDHNQNGKLDLPLNSGGWRETGTFLKATALLPYIASLGANTIHLLPITAIGSDGNKGTLGSPYAIRNPYELDASLGEPNAGLGAEGEFELFVRAAHHLGMRVVVEFVFRTASRDADWVKEHPEWFYWIKAEVHDRPPHSDDESAYGSPIFTEEELASIIESVEKGELGHLLPPHKAYREFFTVPPDPAMILKENGRYIGVLSDGSRVRIPGAFADWPPHDTQPPWGDVTYLKMYERPEFNYIAYNTIRMYDTRLARKENVNAPLWEKITEIIPHYQHSFGIDGVMIDMGHALPMELKQEMIRRARQINPEFAFWDENFSVTEKSVKEGYNAVIGYQWSDQHHPKKFRALLERISGEGFPLPFFATPESHNTPRAAARKGGTRYSRYAWALSNLIPAIPFIHSGVELGETYPINTGLDFTKEELKKLPSEKLPLFSEYAYAWQDREDLIGWFRRLAALRSRYAELIMDDKPGSLRLLEAGSGSVIAFLRSSERSKGKLLVIANSDMSETASAALPLESKMNTLTELLSGKRYSLKGAHLREKLSPGEVLIFELG